MLFGRRYRPWDVFIKSLHAAYGRFLNLGLAEDIRALLADFQSRGRAALPEHAGSATGARCSATPWVWARPGKGLGILSEFAGGARGRRVR